MILRKRRLKLERLRNRYDAKLIAGCEDCVDIAKNTGLPISLIKQIV